MKLLVVENLTNNDSCKDLYVYRVIEGAKKSGVDTL